jgi:hypothetical protein
MHELRYAPDTSSSGIDPSFLIPGWRLGPIRFEAKPHIYQTNFGDLSDAALKSTDYSRAVCSVEIRRETLAYSLKVLFGVYVAVFIALVALVIHPVELCSRFTLGAGAVFAVIGNYLVVSSNMPESSQLTLIDKMHLLAGIAIGLTIAVSAITFPLHRLGRDRVSIAVDRIALLLIVGAFLIVNVALFVGR